MAERFPMYEEVLDSYHTRHNMDGGNNGFSDTTHVSDLGSSYVGAATTGPTPHYLWNEAKELYEVASALPQPRLKVGIVLDWEQYQSIGCKKLARSGSITYTMALADTGCQSSHVHPNPATDGTGDERPHRYRQPDGGNK
jgi:hypothetical protein